MSESAELPCQQIIGEIFSLLGNPPIAERIVSVPIVSDEKRAHDEAFLTASATAWSGLHVALTSLETFGQPFFGFIFYRAGEGKSDPVDCGAAYSGEAGPAFRSKPAIIPEHGGSV